MLVNSLRFCSTQATNPSQSVIKFKLAKGGRIFFFSMPERKNSGQERPFLASRSKMPTADQGLSGVLPSQLNLWLNVLTLVI